MRKPLHQRRNDDDHVMYIKRVMPS